MATCRIRAVLLAKGYDQKTLAADLCITEKAAKRLLYGTCSLYADDIGLLCNKLDVSADFLLGKPGMRIQCLENERAIRRQKYENQV